MPSAVTAKKESEQIVLEAVAAYMNGTSSEKVTEALDNLLRESRNLDREIKGYENEERATLREVEKRQQAESEQLRDMTFNYEGRKASEESAVALANELSIKVESQQAQLQKMRSVEKAWELRRAQLSYDEQHKEIDKYGLGQLHELEWCLKELRAALSVEGISERLEEEK